MIRMQLSAAAELLHARMLGADVLFHGAGIDTRSLAAGELFFALRGNRVDGHDLLDSAAGAGAAAAVVEREARASLPRLLVDDVRAAMGKLAGHWRAQFSLPVIGITGSNGKTTCKEMLGAILGRGRRVLTTSGNLNNDLGVPLTLFRLGHDYDAAVIEMGANHVGEIASLAGLARPDIALVTCCAPAHVEGFGSIEGVARAKGEIYAGLGSDGVAVINADDDYADYWRGIAGPRRTVTFGVSEAAQVRVEDLGPTAAGGRRLRIHFDATRTDIALPLQGRHNALNTAACIAACTALGMTPADCRPGLEAMQAVGGRLQRRAGRAGLNIIDDSYNANPGSLRAAMAVLAEAPGQRWLVLGAMAELGEAGPRYHREAGEQARALGLDGLVAVGELAGLAAEAFGAGGHTLADNAAAAAFIARECPPGCTVLVKGSRSAAMDEVVAALLAENLSC